LLDVVTIFGREGQIVVAGTNADRIEQRILRVPTGFNRITRGSDGAGVDWHGVPPWFVCGLFTGTVEFSL
jgi:hypothetical protein